MKEARKRHQEWVRLAPLREAVGRSTKLMGISEREIEKENKNVFCGFNTKHIIFLSPALKCPLVLIKSPQREGLSRFFARKSQPELIKNTAVSCKGPFA